MDREIADLVEEVNFTVEELEALDAPGWRDAALGVTQATAAGGAAFVIGLSIT
ncbi:hypothetical protein [Streptomyces chrestomyceticus]|uniref:hypothetical protein n=1 Tax=Streptomyces chrestomyceticus TaxID=68185 RepID=UPI0035A828EE